jgi:hypothetical protein
MFGASIHRCTERRQSCGRQPQHLRRLNLYNGGFTCTRLHQDSLPKGDYIAWYSPSQVPMLELNPPHGLNDSGNSPYFVLHFKYPSTQFFNVSFISPKFGALKYEGSDMAKVLGM